MTPADTGRDAAQSPGLLTPLLLRIPAGWWPRVEVPRGWWRLLHQLDAELAEIDPRYELRRAARVDNKLVYLTATVTGGPTFARRVSQAQAAVRAVCTVCGAPGVPRTRSGSVLCDHHWHPPTAAERAFALSADIPEAWFGGEAEIANAAYAARCKTEDRKRSAAHLTELEMAELLHVGAQRIHEMFECDLLAGADHDGRVVYPRWQVTADGRLLPHLAAVLHAACDTDARSLQAIMENAEEATDGLSPAQWLARGRPFEPISALLAEAWWI